MTNDWLGEAEHRDAPESGGPYHKVHAGVRWARNNKVELLVTASWGQYNNGHEQEHDSNSRKFRADNLEKLLRIAISDLRGDEKFRYAFTADVVRRAVYDAQDATGDEVIDILGLATEMAAASQDDWELADQSDLTEFLVDLRSFLLRFHMEADKDTLERIALTILREF
jgi:hypothetical protein